MSRAGRASGAQAKRREVQARVAAAAAEHAAPEEAPAPVELPPEVQVALRAQQLHGRCKAVIVASLWPGETIGAAIAEQWMMNTMRQMQAEAGRGRVLVPS